MPVELRQVTREDIMPDAAFALQRKDRRAALLPMKKLRRIAVGQHCTFYFESFETMLFQIQEMLLIEKGGEAQIGDELEAYNPLIPRGDELVATVMFEIDDPVRRANVLGGLGGVERNFYLAVGDDRVPGVPEHDVERSREDGKTSSVHFLRFALNRSQAAVFRDLSVPVMLGCEDARYGHLAVLSAETRAELGRDLS